MKLLKSLSLPVLLSLAGAHSASAASSTWIATANGSWITAGNWNGGVVPGSTSTSGNGDTATFNSSTGVTVSMANRGLNSLNFDTNAGSFTFSFGAFFFASGGGINLLPTIVSTGQTMTINTPITAVGSFGVNNNATTSNVLQINGNLTNSKSTGGSAIISLGGSNAGTNAIAGIISDGTQLTQINKGGTGTWRLTGSNTYTGGTFVNAGSLVIGVGGAGSVAGAVAVSAGTLGGSGSAGGNVTIGNGTGGADAFIAPGNSAGAFTVAGSLSLLSDATYAFELNSTTGAADKIVANGVTLDSAAVFSFNDIGLGTGITDGQVFTLIDNTSASSISGQFSNLANGSSFISQGITYTASYSGGSGNDLVLTASLVPEPGTCALAFGGLACVLYGRRRRLS